MKAVIVWLVCAIGSYLFSRLFKNLSKDSYEGKPETVGEITSVIDREGGNVMYYVRFTLPEGKLVEAQSVNYSLTKGKYRKGDSVRIKYLLTKSGTPMVQLIDKDLVECRLAAITASRNMKFASLVFLILALVSLILLLF